MIFQVYEDSIQGAECRSCHASIVWTEQTTGKRHPFDGRARDLVFVQIQADVLGGSRTVVGLDSTINTSHFATCPQAKQWRRR